MTTTIKRGDFIRIVRRNFFRSNRVVESEFEKEHKVVKRKKSRWSGETSVYVNLINKIRDINGDIVRVDYRIPIDSVVRTNTTVYKIKKEIMGD